MSCLIASCASSPSEPPPEPGRIIVTETEYAVPPEQYLADCVMPRELATIEAEIRRLARLVECERADKAAIRAWIDETVPESENR